MKKSLMYGLVTLLLTALLVSPALFAGCAKQPAEPGQDILIGILNDLSGPAAAPGKSFQAGMQDYLSYVAEQGGIRGHQVKAITVDTRFEYQPSLQGYEKLVKQDKVSSLIVLATVAAMANKANINNDQIPTIMGFDMNTLLPFEGSYIFAGIPHNSQLIAVALKWIQDTWEKPEPPRIGIHRWSTASGWQFYKGITHWMTQMGMGEPVVDTTARMGNVDYTTQVIAQKEAKVDYIFNYDVAAGFFKDMARLGLKDNVIVIDTAALANEGVPEVLGDDAKGIYVASQYASWSDTDVKGIKLMRDMNAQSHPEVNRRGDWYTLGWVGTAIFVQAYDAVLKEGGYESLTGEEIKNALETQKFDMMGVCTPVGYSPTNHLVTDFGVRVLRHEGMGNFTPVTDWIDAPDWEGEQLTLDWWTTK